MEVEYSRIPIIMKRYSLEEKFAVCQKESKRIIDAFPAGKTDSIFLPWEVEVFALFSIMAFPEYGSGTFKGKGEKQFYKIMESIRSYVHPELRHEAAGRDWAKKFMMVTSLQQFKSQEDIRHRIYRYRQLFSFVNGKVNMPALFKAKYNCTYKELWFPVLTIYLLMSKPNQDISKILNYIITKNLDVLSLLIMDRTKFIEWQNKKIPDGIDSYYYGFKYFYPYPFIEYDKYIYVPLPHLLIDSVTDSILTRLTFGEDNLRSLIGKEVIENYLFEILKDSEAYDEIEKEILYMREGKNQYASPDVMVRVAEKCILFDCKMAVPKLSLRDFSKKDIEKCVSDIAKNVIQLYQQINFFNDDYRPFKYQGEIYRDNIFGVVVLLEEHYLSREDIYQQVFDLLKISAESLDANYISSHVKIVGLNEIEDTSFNKDCFIHRLVSNANDESAKYNYRLINNAPLRQKEAGLSDGFAGFIQEIESEARLFAEELKEQGLF